MACDERGPIYLHADVLHPLQRLAPGDEGGEQHIAERPVLVQQGSQHVAIDGDVTQRLGGDGRQERGLTGEEAQFAEEVGVPVADDLVAARVEDRHLTFDDGDEREALVADAKQGFAYLGRALLSELGQRLQLRVRQRRARRQRCERISPRHGLRA